MISGASQADIGVLVSLPMFLSRTFTCMSFAIWSLEILFVSLLFRLYLLGRENLKLGMREVDRPVDLHKN